MFKKIVIVFGVILSLLFGFAFHLAGGSLVIKEVFKHQPKENLEFRFSSCEGHVSGRDKVIRNEIINGH